MRPACLILTGHYGSGKTEYALCKAEEFSRNNLETYLCDLDVINPYFRSRDCKDLMSDKGVNLVAPENDLMKADIPVVTGEVSARIQDRSAAVILDAGGDGDGAAVLGQFSGMIKERPYEFLFVVNINRPHVSGPEGIKSAVKAVEKRSRLKVSGLINNTHLGGEHVSSEDIKKGIEVCRKVEEDTGIPLCTNMVEAESYRSIKEDLAMAGIKELTVFDRKLLAPWQVRRSL